jgi:hypothetical protein
MQTSRRVSEKCPERTDLLIVEVGQLLVKDKFGNIGFVPTKHCNSGLGC